MSIPRQRIALIAHDGCKEQLIDWVTEHSDTLVSHDLIATGTTGEQVEEVLNAPVRKLLSGPKGGDQQIGALIAEGQVDILIFFWDPMAAQPHDPDVKALLRIGVLYDIAMASNLKTANLLVTGLLTKPELVDK
ncbi:MAG TPA: methylglyoxal synthase [Spirosoma sp.]|jgi:methylglyoxal synthase|nr:methylglyoxal synthase [Spirosoma sp.]